MEIRIAIRTLWGDSFLLTNSSSGHLKAHLETSQGHITLQNIRVLGLDASLDDLELINPRVLSTRFTLSHYKGENVLLYNHGLQGGGACCSKNKF